MINQIPSYVDTFEEEPEVDMVVVQQEIDKSSEDEQKDVLAEMDRYLKELMG
jgi:hypothetical protein